MTTVVTGSTGFIGRALCAQLHARGLPFCAVARRPSLALPGTDYAVVPNIDGDTDWRLIVKGCQTVIHLAGYAHILRQSSELLSLLQQTNVDGTLALARQAAQAGVRRFIFISSIKVNGESTFDGRPFRVTDLPQPMDAYATSKLLAEQELWQIAAKTGMEVVVIRPPLAYGPGVKGNFARLMHSLNQGLPLPLGCAEHNRRSLVALDNLIDLLLCCMEHPNAANQTFLVSDGDDLSTADLLRRLGRAIGKPARLLPVPLSFLRFSAAVSGRAGTAQRLLGNLQVDLTHTCQTLGWRPPISVNEGLRRVVKEEPRTSST